MGVPLLLSGLRISSCHCSSTGCCPGARSIPGPGISHLPWIWPKRRKEERNRSPSSQGIHDQMRGLEVVVRCCSSSGVRPGEEGGVEGEEPSPEGPALSKGVCVSGVLGEL